MKIYVGYDGREELAWQVCRFSIQQRAKMPVEVIPLRHKALRQEGMFKRRWEIDALGQMYDREDEKPCSTEFSHSRFLVPSLARKSGQNDGWVAFVDCDFLFLEDVQALRDEADNSKAVMVVQRKWEDVPEGTKMDGVKQERYPKKLWSSLMLFNLQHPENDALTPGAVNSKPGSWLHGFEWLSREDLIGHLSPRWNYIPQLDADFGHSGAIHYSLGGPWMGIKSGPVADQLWINELGNWADHLSHSIRFGSEGNRARFL